MGNCFYCYHLNYKIIEFVFLLTFLIFIDLLVHLAYVFVLLAKWLRSCKYIFTIEKFVLNVSYVIRCHLVFFFESISWGKRDKKQENSIECFSYSLWKTVIHFIVVKSSPQSLTQQNQKFLEPFCSNEAFIQVTKMTRNKSQLFKETTWRVTLMCHRSACKSSKMQTWFFMHCQHKPLVLQYTAWVVFFW